MVRSRLARIGVWSIGWGNRASLAALPAWRPVETTSDPAGWRSASSPI